MFDRLRGMPLMDLVPAIGEIKGAGWKSPYHLAPYCDAIESCIEGHKRIMISVPFQHYKSTTTLCGAIWLLLRNPRLRILILTHSHDKATAMGKDLRELWRIIGGETKKGFDTISDWQTPEGGGCIVMSVDQSRLGFPHDILLVDDPVNEHEYMLQDARDHADKQIAMYTTRGATHLDSVILIASRWHPDDPTGRRERRVAVKWEYFSASGIQGFQPKPEGWSSWVEWLTACGAKSFAPDVLSLEQHVRVMLEQEEHDPSLRFWWAQMQNEPMPDATAFFPGERLYTGMHPAGVPLFGVDAAYTQGKKSDYFACYGGIMPDDNIWVVDGYWHQHGLHRAIGTLTDVKKKWTDCRFVTYASGPEIGIYHALFQMGAIEVEIMPARWNKATRASKTSKSWQDGRILVPRDRPFGRRLIANVHTFDGSEGNVDDDTDALVAMHDCLMMNRPVPGFERGFGFGQPVM